MLEYHHHQITGQVEHLRHHHQITGENIGLQLLIITTDQLLLITGDLLLPLIIGVPWITEVPQITGDLPITEDLRITGVPLLRIIEVFLL